MKYSIDSIIAVQEFLQELVLEEVVQADFCCGCCMTSNFDRGGKTGAGKQIRAVLARFINIFSFARLNIRRFGAEIKRSMASRNHMKPMRLFKEDRLQLERCGDQPSNSWTAVLRENEVRCK